MLKSNDILSEEFREGFLKVFRSFVRKLRKWFAPLFNEDMCALSESDEKHIEFLVTVDQYVHKNKNPSLIPNRVKDEELSMDDVFRRNVKSVLYLK